VAFASPLGRFGMVTTTIPVGGIGEVRVEISGGTTTYHAYSVNRAASLARGSRVKVVEVYPPRTIVVEPTD